MSTQITIGLAFLAGLASFLSPCVLPLVPIYLAQLVGQSVYQATDQKKNGLNTPDYLSACCDFRNWFFPGLYRIRSDSEHARIFSQSKPGYTSPGRWSASHCYRLTCGRHSAYPFSLPAETFCLSSGTTQLPRLTSLWHHFWYRLDPMYWPYFEC